MQSDRFDYIVVGAGSAGCVVARRLSDRPDLNVLLLEAGPEPTGFWQRVPAGMAKMFGPNPFNWSYTTEPEPALDARRVFWPRGKTLGGSSAINGMVFTRGLRGDYDGWRDAGNAGWGWDDVLPYFRRMEDNDLGESPSRGIGGPLRVRRPAMEPPVVRRFIDAVAHAGVPHVEDFSTAGSEGVGVLQTSIAAGQRQSAYDAYIASVRRRPNLQIATRTQVMRLVFEGSAAVGVEVRDPSGASRILRAAREVIVCAGAVNTPQLLMLSGVGDEGGLARVGITPRMHLPGVGRNLQDHISVIVKARTRRGWSHNRQLLGWRKYREGARYLLTRGGYLACPATLAAAYFRSHDRLDHPDLDIGFRPITFSYSPSGNVTVDGEEAVAISVFVSRPASRGHVQLQSADPFQPPRLVANYFGDERDMQATLRGVRIVRSLLASDPLAACIVDEMSPGIDTQCDDALSAFVRATAKTSFHLAGTCKMGQDDEAVVDHRLRVRGVPRLRIVDASIMPVVTSGNTNAPALMIGERGADLILEDLR